MRCKVLVLTHGNLAEAFVHAVSLIYGEVPQLAFKNMPEQLDIGQYRKELEACVRENEATGILVVPNGSTNSSKRDTIFLCGVFFVLFSAITYLGV